MIMNYHCCLITSHQQAVVLAVGGGVDDHFLELLFVICTSMTFVLGIILSINQY